MGRAVGRWHRGQNRLSARSKFPIAHCFPSPSFPTNLVLVFTCTPLFPIPLPFHPVSVRRRDRIGSRRSSPAGADRRSIPGLQAASASRPPGEEQEEEGSVDGAALPDEPGAGDGHHLLLQALRLPPRLRPAHHLQDVPLQARQGLPLRQGRERGRRGERGRPDDDHGPAHGPRHLLHHLRSHPRLEIRVCI